MERHLHFPAHQLLDTVVLGIRNVKITMGVQRDAPRIAEFAGRAPRTSNYFNTAMVTIENLDAAVAELTDKLKSATIHTHVIGITQFVCARPGFTIAGGPFAVGRENLYAVIARIGNIQSALS